MIDDEDDQHPPYWQEASSYYRKEDVVVRMKHVDLGCIAEAWLIGDRPTWVLENVWVAPAQQLPTGTAYVGIWQAIVLAASVNGATGIDASTLPNDHLHALSVAGLRPFIDGWCRLEEYRGRLIDKHEPTFELYFRGVGLESLIVPPKTWRVK